MARHTSRSDATRRSSAAALLAVTAASALTLSATVLTMPAAADPGPQKTHHHAVVLVNFRNAKLAGPDADRQDARSHFFGPADSLTSYYAANSGGRLSVVPAKGDGVFGPFDLDMDNSTCDTGKMAALARKAVQDVTYDHLSIVMPSTKACEWWGLGNQPGDTTWFQEGAVKDLAAIAHEIGHNLGFAHQDRQVCTPGSFTACTADGYSRRTPMGAGGEKKGLSAPELLAQKWLPGEQIVTPGSTATVHLTPLHAAASTAGARAIDLPLGSGGDRVVVEYRTPEASTPDRDVAQGVVVYRVPKGQYDHAVMISNGKQDDKTIAGSLKGAEALSDTASGLSVSITNATAGGADVRIGFGTVPGPTSSASPTKPGAGTTPAPTLSTSTSPTPPAPVQPTREGDVTTDIGATGLPTPSTGTSAGDATATATAAGAAATGPDSLAHTGATTTVTAVVGGLLILVGGTTAVTVARRRRP
ncbi:hypothetical protein RMN57_06490 [Kitasatospora sp. CM 4170]|uniref:Peptidase M11 gametolysin domain-containing protein n=1 Tax=Kitasatospora aburaviensis TaxID=67265 RepID=A0ABW1ER31_9ACTN|nr:hypothetical protein [Kitasatospora sp. CM 4170]WNM44378.1 hypothetical protein RMN57_06490 [Kitasatospora sp. CM 4170]